jgi:ATP-dependent exoDNAse (exonuclease V) alpha subunit
VLVIDEISMLQPRMFDLLAVLFGLAASTRTPFGRTRLLMVGDFTQLAPVAEGGGDTYVFQTAVWRRLPLTRVVLDRCMRQSGDDVFAQLLDRVRRGVLEPGDRERLTRRSGGASAVHICTHRRQVAGYNTAALQQLAEGGAVVHTFYPVLSCGYTRDESGVLTRGRGTELALRRATQFVRGRGVGEALRVSAGARVMLTCNAYTHSHNVAHGSLGTVVRTTSDTISVRFDQEDSVVDIRRHETSTVFSPGVDVHTEQFPLRLAWALTVHAVQGLTLESACVVGHGCFAPGQLYVALSRVPTLGQLSVQSLPAQIEVDPEAVAFELGTVDPALYPTMTTVRLV